MRKISYKVGVVLLVATMLLTGCKDTDPVVTIGDRSFMPGEYLAAQLDAYYEVYADFSYNSEFLTESYEDGTTAAAKISELTDNTLKQIAYAEINFDDAGKTLTEDQLLVFEQNFEYIYQSQQEFYADNGVGEDSFRSYYLALYKFRALYEEQYYGEGELAPKVEELAEYYGETYTPITRASVSTVSTDYTALDEATILAQKELADEMVAHLEENNDFDAAIEEFMPEVLTNTGGSYTEDSPESYYYSDEVSENNTVYSAEEIEQISSQQAGTVGILEQENALIIYRVNEDYVDISEIEAKRSTLTDEIYYEAFEEMAIEEANEYGFTADSYARSYYNVDRIV